MTSFVPELPSDSIEMCLVEMQNPTTLWVVDMINKQISKNFYDLEERLKQVLERSKLQCFNRVLNIGDLVAVYDPVSGAWCRAKICDIYQKLSKFVYSVFLLDRGYSITSEISNIKELPPEGTMLQFRCYHVQLYGIVPVSTSNSIASPENTEIQPWLPEAVIETKKLLDTCEAIYFTPKLARRIVYGDIHLKFGCRYVQLANYLCDGNFAVCNTSSFEMMMETAPYMSCQEGFCLNDSKENRSISDYINARQPTDKTDNFTEETDCEKLCDKNEQIPSTFSKANLSTETDSNLVSQTKPEGSQRRTSALQQFYEEMRQSDKHSSRPTGLHQKHTENVKGALNNSPHKKYTGIGRGERLQMLQKLYAAKKPGEGTCSNVFSNEVTNISVEDDLMLVDKFSNMSIIGNKRPWDSGNQFYERNGLRNSMCYEKDTKTCVVTNPSESHTGKQHMEKQFPVSNGSVFCRRTKLVFLPAGSEESMLVSKKKVRKNESCAPDHFTGESENNS